MDPTTLIVTALTTGATFIAKQIGGDAVKDGYSGLKELLKKRFINKPQAEIALIESEKDPETWEKPLSKAVAEARAGDDSEVVSAAQRLLSLLDPEGANSGKYNVVIHQGKGVVIGDHNKVTQNFGENTPDK